MIYVPFYTSSSCVVVSDKDTIRVYSEKPTRQGNYNYTDYFINSNYLSKTGIQNFNQYSTFPTCVEYSNLTNEVYYRNDFDKILIIFIILCLVIFLIPLKLFTRFFKRYR